ncbi:MAG TPA: hypothetical protein VMB74_04185 [Streptosporangiaceae bacterium]|nr:hypothetical protein [Streptosporangiaceae bacterium]
MSAGSTGAQDGATADTVAAVTDELPLRVTTLEILRAAAAVAALATIVAGVAAGLRVQLLLVAVVLTASLTAEGREGGDEPAEGHAAG